MTGKLYDVRMTGDTDLEIFLKEMREKFPGIVGRKRFCCYENELTPDLDALFERHKIELVAVN